jgi:hypothetical protein
MSAKPLIQGFHDDITDVISKYSELGLTFGEAIGVLEVAKMDMWQIQKEEDEDIYGDPEKNE